jgi:hypothetical protein
MRPSGQNYPSASRYVRLLLVTLGSLALASCKDQGPAAPNVVGIARTAVGLSNAADQGWVRGSNFVDFVQFVPCLGENVRVFGEVPFEVHAVSTPSGGFNLTWRFPPVTPNTPQFYIQGLSTGKLYTYDNGHAVLALSQHVAAGQVFSVHDREVYTAADGSKLFVTNTMHATINANGVVTVSRQEFEDINCG